MTAPDPLAEIRDQLRAATDAAERLVRDARPDPPGPGRGPGRPDAGGRAAGRPGATARGPGRPDATGRGAGRPDATGPAPPAGWQAADEGSVPPELLALARLL
ncbi:MAG: hypothetical protein QOE27_2945, partial [Solirubrobacteraceae bacterium]|nr:hypothetical protein [Solirubrobacteraceae bacterium]